MTNDIKVLFDHQIFALQRMGGISRIFHELSKNLPTYHVDPACSSIYGQSAFLPGQKLLPGTESLPFKLSSRMNEFANRHHSMKELRSKKYQIFHPTYFSPYFLPAHPVPLVVTVYDMIHERFANFPRKQIISKNKARLVRAADKVIAISEQTKQDLLAEINISPDKVEVVHLATSIQNEIPKKINLGFEKYLLYVGERGGYKNFDFLLQAFSKIESRELKLLCVGGGPFSPKEQKRFLDLGINGKVFQKRLSDAELAWAYQNCVAFVMPSLYEGFGIPILESMQMGAITLLSNQSCLPEIGQDGAAYFNNQAELVDLIVSAFSTPNVFRPKLARASEIVREFSWDLTAQKTAKVYQSLIS